MGINRLWAWAGREKGEKMDKGFFVFLARIVGQEIKSSLRWTCISFPVACMALDDLADCFCKGKRLAGEVLCFVPCKSDARP